MMKKLLVLHFLLSAFAIKCLANEDAPIRMTPFSGMDYVRVVVDAGYKLSSINTFKAVLRSIAGGQVLWQGAVNLSSFDNGARKQLTFTIKDLKPVCWMPSEPFLYELTLQQFNKNKLVNQLMERVGFRSFERRNGNLYLNNRPIFLRGIAINPPGRGIPDKLEKSREFALEYVKYMKSINVNIIRIPDDENWYDVCDELGMMVFGGNYSGIVAAEKPPENYDKGVNWYEHDKLGPIAHHPSLMVYAMTNETPFRGEEAQQWEKFLSYAFDKLKKWDDTRVYIANAGYGYGKAGDICDIHRYWGWYYSSPFTFLHIRNNADIIPFPKKDQPITFTECVGNYTGPDGRYNLTPAHKNPSSQLAWTGHERQDLQAHLADEHQSFTLKQATETFRQTRSINHDLSGVFPFTILFYNWDEIEKFADMNPKPVTDQVKISYQPVLLSWECWTPHLYAGSVVKTIAHVINDDNNFKDLSHNKLVYQLRDKTESVLVSDSIALPDIPYYATVDKKLDIRLPADLISGKYELMGRLISNGKIVSENTFTIFIGERGFAGSAPASLSGILLYDENGKTANAFSTLNIPYKRLSSFTTIPPNSCLIIGENAADDKFLQSASVIKEFIKNGGRVLCLRQDSTHLPAVNSVLEYRVQNSTVDIDDPVYPVSSVAPRNGYYVNPERIDHPVFSGITRDNLKVWSDYTGWDETKAGFPAIYPVTDGFVIDSNDGISHTAILGNYGSGLQAIALAEQFTGAGSITLCGFDIINRVNLDPVADRLLLNLVTYSGTPSGHELYQLITGPITWGEYETEKGIVTDIYSGFLVNATPRLTPSYMQRGIVVTKEGYQLAGGDRSGFNTRPGLQYVANGRRPFGPYVQTFGGQPRPLNSTNTGVGKFWCKIPEGQNMSGSVIWNPGDEPLEIKIKINDLPEIAATIRPGEKRRVDCPVNSTNVNMTYTGDRRLVVLETAFRKQ